MKNIVRNALVSIAVFLTLPLWLPVHIACIMRISDELFATCSQIISIFPGVLGVYLRRGFYRMTLEQCAMDCSVGCGTWFSHPKVRIGNNVYIGGRCSIGMCNIGNDVLIGSNVDILSGRHQHGSGSSDLPRPAQGGTFSKVSIGNNVWLGNSSVVMADVGNDSVIGAGSVVVKPIPPASIAVGNPATVKKSTA